MAHGIHRHIDVCGVRIRTTRLTPMPFRPYLPPLLSSSLHIVPGPFPEVATRGFPGRTERVWMSNADDGFCKAEIKTDSHSATLLC